MQSTEEFEKEYENLFNEAFASVADCSCHDVKHLTQVLKDKRIFGKSKYKDLCFQISRKNALEVDTIQHAQEEIVDLINYTTHTLVQYRMGKNLPIPLEKLEYMLYFSIQMKLMLDEYTKNILN